MPCEANLTPRVGDALFNFPLEGMSWGIVAWSNMAAQIQGIYPGLSCSDIESALPSLFSTVSTFGYPPEGQLITTPTLASQFVASNVTGAGSAVINSYKSNGMTTESIAEWHISWDGAGVVTMDSSVIDIASFNIDNLTSMYVSNASGPWNSSATITVHYDYLGYVGSPDYSALLGCLIPACATSSSPLPQLGSTVKCANFSKIFNPLGIPIRSNK